MKKRRRNNRRWEKMTSRKINTRMSKKLVGLFLIVILALVGLAIRITYINIVSGTKYEQEVLKGLQSRYGDTTIPFKRGDILDRNGTILATSDKVYNLVLDCAVTNDISQNKDNDTERHYVEPTVRALVDVFGLDENWIRSLLDSEETKDSRYQVVLENLSLADRQRMEDYLSETEADGLTEEEVEARQQVANNSCIWFEPDYLRVYPLGSQACDVIGFTNSDNTADWGIEGYYSDILNGTNGRQFGYINTDADVEQTIIDAVDGQNVISTIDMNVQQIIRNAIENYQLQYSNGPNGEEAAENVGVVVMDPNTGEILGMDSTNWYDLNDPRSYTVAGSENMTDEEIAEETRTALNARWRNFCISDTFEPGSTMKPMTAAAALETNSISVGDTYYCDGYEIIGDSTIHCAAYPGEHGEENLRDALVVSCNDVLMQIASKMGVSNMLKYQSLYNFGSKTGIDLPGEGSGITHTSESMGDAELATTSFGQGFTCTMIQEAAAFSSVINGGYYYKPHIVSAITDSNGAVVEDIENSVERQVVSSSVSSTIRSYLGGVVETGGSGTDAKVPGYSMGGKTGTAQKLDSESHSYEGDYVVSFIGFAPLNDPQVVVYVVVDEPNAEDQGKSVFAQAIAKEIFAELLPYMNIFPDETVTETSDASAVQEDEQSIETSDADVQNTGTPDTDASGEDSISAQEQDANSGVDADIPEESENTAVESGENDLYTDGISN